MGGVDGLWERSWSQFILNSGGWWLSWFKHCGSSVESRWQSSEDGGSPFPPYDAAKLNLSVLSATVKYL
ncbi:hypothetical protein Pcinc_029548 [Petrolisthes cinctipes]|uniref:Uncharacterized protein n=1 Tax=Petrolisthes cinctipes TaxID=88211 RepID=A0AAE1K7N2_PETCI|nr:hypothetical protein Pcinc_029548 [Petrolisthes cinctipes]